MFKVGCLILTSLGGKSLKKSKTSQITTTLVVPEETDVKKALLKKALGYKVTEVVEEYAIVDSELKLVKKKINTKTCPPDLDAIELALSNNTPKSEYYNYTDEELLEEKANLTEMFKRIKEISDEST